MHHLLHNNNTNLVLSCIAETEKLKGIAKLKVNEINDVQSVHNWDEAEWRNYVKESKIELISEHIMNCEKKINEELNEQKLKIALLNCNMTDDLDIELMKIDYKVIDVYIEKLWWKCFGEVENGFFN